MQWCDLVVTNRRGEKGSAQQAELIRYLHRQRDSLSQEVLRLNVLLERWGLALCVVARKWVIEHFQLVCIHAGGMLYAAGCQFTAKLVFICANAGAAADFLLLRTCRRSQVMRRQRTRRRRERWHRRSCCGARTAAPGRCWMSGRRPSSGSRCVSSPQAAGRRECAQNYHPEKLTRIVGASRL